MAKCPNRNTAEYKALQAEFGTNIKTDNIINVYQEINNTEDIPTVAQAKTYLKDQKAALSAKKLDFREALEKNIIGTRRASRYNDVIYVNNTAKGTRISNKKIAQNNIQRIQAFLDQNNISYGPRQMVEFVETDNTYKIVINEDLFTMRDVIPEAREDAKGPVRAILNHLNRMFPQVTINNVTRVEAEKIYNSLPADQRAKIPFSEVKSFYANGQAYIIGQRINGDVAIEEVLHPFTDAMYKENRALFDGLLREAKETFGELRQQINQAYSNDRGFNQMHRDLELVTQALTRHFRQEYETQPTKGFLQKVKEFLEWFSNILKDLHKFITNRDLAIKTSDIKETSSLSDIAKLLNTDDIKFKFEFKADRQVRYSLDDKTKAAMDVAMGQATTDVQKDLIAKLLNVAKETDKEITGFSASKNPELFDSASLVVLNEEDHTYYDIETGEEFYSTTRAIKGEMLNKEDNEINLAVGNDFDAILNAVVSKTLVEDIEGITKLSKEQVEQVYVDLQSHLDSLTSDGSVAIPQVVLFDNQTIEINGKTYGGIAGTGDILLITPDGKIKVLDLKTSQNYLKTDPDRYEKPYPLQDDSLVKQKSDKEALSTKAQHNLQIAIYRRMLQNMGYTVADGPNAISTFHIKVDIEKDAKGKKVWKGGYQIEGIYRHSVSQMEEVVDKIIPENLDQEQQDRINDARKTSPDYNMAEEELSGDEAQSENNNNSNAEVNYYLGALEEYSAGLVKRRDALRKLKGGLVLDMTKEGTISAINDTIASIEVAVTQGPQAIRAEYTRVIRQGIKDLQQFTDYILDSENIGKPEYINYVLNFDRYAQTFNGLIELSTIDNTPLSKTQANLVLQLQAKLQRLRGSQTETGLVDTAIFNFVKETVRAASSAEFSDADLDEILTSVRDINDIEYQTGDMATNRDTLLAVLDKIYKYKEQEYLDKAQARENKIRAVAGKLAKLDPSTKPEDLYNFMLEFDEAGLPTGYIVQRLGPQYYNKIKELRDLLFDEDGNRMEYIEKFNEDEATPEELAYNKKLYELKQENARFWRAERGTSEGDIVDGDYHAYTEEFKTLRAKYERPEITASGFVIWKKKRSVDAKSWRKFRQTYGEYKETFFMDKKNGEPTGTLSPGQIWVPYNKYRYAKAQATVNGKKVSMLNEKYDAIMNPAVEDELSIARREFYQFYVETMEELTKKLPPNVMEQMAGRIPTILANKIKREGPVVAKMFAKMKRNVGDFFKETGSYRRVVVNEKGEIANTLPIYYTGNLATEKDLEKIEEKRTLLKTRLDSKAISKTEYRNKMDILDVEEKRLRKKPTRETLNTDLGTSLLKFNTMAENFEVMSTIEDIVTSFIKVSDKREVLAPEAKSDNVVSVLGNAIVSGASKARKMVPVGTRENDLEKNIQKRIKKWARMVFYDNENLTQTALEKMSGLLMGYSSFAYVATNPLGNINNLTIGLLNNTIELMGGRFFKRRAYLQMKKEFNVEQVLAKSVRRTGYILDGKKGYYDPKKPMTKWEGWVDVLRMMDKKTEIRETDQDSYFEKAGSWFYLLNDSFEYNVQTKIGMAMVASHKAVDENGNEVNLYEASTWDSKNQTIVIDPKYKIYDMNGNEVEWNDQYRYKLRNQIREVNKRIHGSYARADRMVMQSHFLGKLAVQFKKWVAPSIKSRMRREQYDENLGWVEGRYRSFTSFFAFAFKNLSDIKNLNKVYAEKLAEDFAREEGINYGHVEQRIKNKITGAYTTMGEIGLVLTIWALTELLGGVLATDDDDGEVEKRLKNLLKYNADRASKELYAFWPVVGWPQAYQLIKNPIASANVLGQFSEAIYSTGQTAVYGLFLDDKEFRKNKEVVYQRGKRKGDLKMSKEWNDVLPFLYTIQRWQNFDQEREFYVK